jgi:hypothetical protein
MKTNIVVDYGFKVQRYESQLMNILMSGRHYIALDLDIREALSTIL